MVFWRISVSIHYYYIKVINFCVFNFYLLILLKSCILGIFLWIYTLEKCLFAAPGLHCGTWAVRPLVVGPPVMGAWGLSHWPTRQVPKPVFLDYLLCVGCYWPPCCMLSHYSHVRLFLTPCTAARQAPLSVGFSRQEYWSGLPFPPPGDLPHPGTEFAPLRTPALAGGFFTTSTTHRLQ